MTKARLKILGIVQLALVDWIWISINPKPVANLCE